MFWSIDSTLVNWHTKSDVVVSQAVLTIPKHITKDNESPEMSEVMVGGGWSGGYGDLRTEVYRDRLNIDIKFINDPRSRQLKTYKFVN